MCLITHWVHTCGCPGEGDYPELCPLAIAETEHHPMGPMIGTTCPKTTVVEEVDELCPNHERLRHERLQILKARARNFVEAVTDAAICRGLPCNAERHAHNVDWTHLAVYDLFAASEGRHALMMSLDAMVNLHLGILSPEPAAMVNAAISACEKFTNDSNIIKWSLPHISQGKSVGMSRLEVVAQIREKLRVRGAEFRAIGRLAED